MSLAYYNEIDPYCAQWLRNLIAKNLIAPGVVDERSILDVKPYELEPYTQCHFFAGIGGWSYALRLAGVADHREIWTGSCPCQPFSTAGRRRGFDDERHLWPYWRYLIAQRRPPTIFGEQVASAADWLRLVRSDLEALDYAVGAVPIEAASAGADHLRDRFWFMAYHTRQQVGAAGQSRERSDVAHSSSSTRLQERERDGGIQRETLGAQPRQDVANAGAARDMGDANFFERWFGNQQSAWQQPEQQRDQTPRFVGNGSCPGGGRNGGTVFGTQAQGSGERLDIGRQSDEPEPSGWIIGADGKARRVKSGIRLLVDGFPNRVGLLRGFGNAIDPRPAAQFIKAALD